MGFVHCNCIYSRSAESYCNYLLSIPQHRKPVSSAEWKQIKLVVMLVYLFSVVSAIPDFLVMEKKKGSTCSPQFDEPLYLLLYQAFVLLLIFVFPTMVLSVFYFKLSIYLWRHDKYILNQCHSGQKFSSDNLGKKKIHLHEVKHLGRIHTFIISFIAVLIYIHLCCLLPENILSLMPTSNSLMPTSNSLTQNYIHFVQSSLISVDKHPFASKGIP